jgi:hypothetical protein
MLCEPAGMVVFPSLRATDDIRNIGDLLGVHILPLGSLSWETGTGKYFTATWLPSSKLHAVDFASWLRALQAGKILMTSTSDDTTLLENIFCDPFRELVDFVHRNKFLNATMTC